MAMKGASPHPPDVKFCKSNFYLDSLESNCLNLIRSADLKQNRISFIKQSDLGELGYLSEAVVETG